MARNLSKKPREIIKDSIHGIIELHPVVKLIIDTPQFQRLKAIQQLSGCEYVYPTAKHDRYQHSLGVAHLAQKLVEKLRDNLNEPKLVTEQDVLCVMLAGLCHDLGHGPLSHLWEFFLKEVLKDKPYEHEETTLKMFDYLLDSNNIRKPLMKLAKFEELDVIFIKELMTGNPLEKGGRKEWPYKGRGPEKQFLYEIVANKTNNIDVDKMDYIIRDDYHMKIGHAFDLERCLQFIRVEETGEPKRPRICFRKKEEEALLELDRDRSRLHRLGYQHRVVKSVNRMLMDAWKLASEHVVMIGSNGKKFNLTNAHEDMMAFEQLTDKSLEEKILGSSASELKDAQEILKRINRHDFYKSFETRETKENPGFNDNKLLDLYIQRKKTEGLVLDRNEFTIIWQKIKSNIHIDKISFWDYTDKATDKICFPCAKEIQKKEENNVPYICYKGTSAAFQMSAFK